MSTALEIGDFPRFFEAVRGHPPFPWQTRLVETIDRRGAWPSLLDLPTGSGKTAVLDVATFLLALDATRGDVRMPRRTVLVVDRRIVVDQAASAGQGLLQALLAPRDPVVERVADGLRSLSGTDVPLVCATLRGGITLDESWARRPDVPALISSTVDQVGSRLLFRGYGVSPAMRPVHSGLLGCDTLVVLDEVHLSRSFAQTLRAIDARYRGPERERLAARWQVVEMSATPGEDPLEPFRLEPSSDLDPDRSPVLSRRVRASKPVSLREIPGRRPDRQTLAENCAVAAVELLGHAHVRVVGVIVNRVQTAHAVARILRERGVETALLTGRMRPFDRDDRLGDLEPRLRTGRVRRDEDQPLVVVATQCIEAGADFDLDGLVTECASLDALRQRFGRVDRDGRLSEAGTPAPGLILALPSDLGDETDDPVYGAALSATWRWLRGLPEPDLGVSRLELPAPDALPELLSPQEHAPVLFPAHLDAWVQTAPEPRPDPDVGLWLHGLRPATTDVQVVWRADLDRDLLEALPAEAALLVEACPPASLEAVTVPLAAARRWLRQSPGPGHDIPDVEGSRPTEADESDGLPRPFLHRRSGEWTVSPGPSTLAPGDVIVVPSRYGGLTDLSWDEAGTDPVSDLGHRAQLDRRRAVLRLIPSLCTPVPVPDADDEESPPGVVARGWLREHGDALDDPSAREAARRLLRGGRLEVQVRWASSRSRLGDGVAGPADGVAPPGRYLVCSGFTSARGRAGGLSPASSTEPALSPFSGPREVTLDEHLDGVGRVAEAMGRNCGLPAGVVEDVALAARLHDLGKLDPRFQRWLHDGDELAAALADTPLAKSALPSNDRARRELARRRSGYPAGARHELLSVALAADETLMGPAHDRDLVLHLIASHHGHCRPFAPVVLDAAPVTVSGAAAGHSIEARTDHGLERLDSGVPDRFWRLVERYGVFGLTWLEAILRLADHRESDDEQTRHAR